MPPTMHRPECPQGSAFAVKLVNNALSLGSSAHADTGVIMTACTAQIKLAWSLFSICCPASLALLTMSASMPASLATCKHSIWGTWRRTHTHTHTLMDKIKCKPCASPMQDRTPASPVPQAGNDLPPESFCHSKQSALSIEKAAKRSWFTGRLLLGLSEMAPCHETQAGSSRARPGDHSSLELRLCRACTGRQDHHPAHCPAPLHTHHTIQSGPVSYFDYRYDYTCSAFV